MKIRSFNTCCLHIFPFVMLLLGACEKMETPSTPTPTPPTAEVAPPSKPPKPLSLVARLASAQEVDYDSVVETFLAETKSDNSLRLKLLRARNDEGQNSLHVLMAKTSLTVMATAKTIYAEDNKLMAHKDHYGHSPIDAFVGKKENLTSVPKLSQLITDFSRSYCERLGDQDTVLAKIARLPQSTERDDALLHALKNGGMTCLTKMGFDYATPAELLMASPVQGTAFARRMVDESLSIEALERARQKAQKIATLSRNARSRSASLARESDPLKVGMTRAASQKFGGQTRSASDDTNSSDTPPESPRSARRSASSHASLVSSSSSSNDIEPVTDENDGSGDGDKTPTTLALKIAAINDYLEDQDRRRLTDGDVTAIECFLNALFADVSRGKRAWPQQFLKGKHLIDGVELDLPVAVHAQSVNKIALTLAEVIYEANEGDEKIVSAFDPINGIHLVKREATANEAQIYQKLAANPQQGLVEVHSVQPSQTAQFVFMKRYENSSLDKILDDIMDGKIESLNVDKRLSIIRKLLKGVKNLHGMKIRTHIDGTSSEVPISHRDLKPGNIFCEGMASDNMACVIGDFDTSIQIEIPAGTPGYFAPETIEFARSERMISAEAVRNFNISAGPKADIFSLGIIAYNLLSVDDGVEYDIEAIMETLDTWDANPRNLPEYDVGVYEKIVEGWHEARRYAKPKALTYWDLVRLMLEKDPHHRPDPNAALLYVRENKFKLGQHLAVSVRIDAKKLVGGLEHYCYIDQADHLFCRGADNRVELVPAHLVGKSVKDIIAGEHVMCAVLDDASLQCFGEAVDQDLSRVNGEFIQHVIIYGDEVIAIDSANQVISSSRDVRRLTGQSIDATKLNFMGIAGDLAYWISEADYGQGWNEFNMLDLSLSEGMLGTKLYRDFGNDFRGFINKPIRMVMAYDQVLGVAGDFSAFGTLTIEEDDILKHNKFLDITLGFRHDTDEVVREAWFRVEHDIAIDNDLTIKKGAWVKNQGLSPVDIFGHKGDYEEVIIGKSFRCARDVQSYFCDRWQ